MSAMFNLSDLVVHGGEPVIHDLKLARALGYERPRKIRDLIKRNLAELQRFGEVVAMMGLETAEGAPHGVAPPPHGGARAPHGGAPPPHGVENSEGVLSTVDKTPRAGGRPIVNYYPNEGQALLIAIKSGTERAADVREGLIRVFLEWRKGTLEPREDDAPLAELQNWRNQPHAVVGLLSWITRGWGFDVAASFLPQLGLSALPKRRAAIAPRSEGEVVLDRILAASIGARSVHELLLDAVGAGDVEAGKVLDEWGIGPDPEGGGFFVGSTAAGIKAAMAGHRGRHKFWRLALNDLPGADDRPGYRTSFGGKQTRVTWLPLDLLE